MTQNSHEPPEWKRELANSIRSLDAMQRRFPAMVVTDAMRRAADLFLMSVTPYYASLIERPDFGDPIFAQCVPDGRELHTPSWLSSDPLHEQTCSPVPCLVHRYPDRALIVSTSACATYCRHCTRKRVSSTPDTAITDDALDACAAYLAAHPEIDDVLVSGGDPMLLDDDRLDHILGRIRAVPSVKAIRVATRTLVNLPMRFTPDVVAMLRNHAPLFVNTHFNHPVELTPRAIAAASRLVDAGIPVSNQTVLLRGVNDSEAVVEALCRKLFHNRIRPYYLFQCDLVNGIEHLRTPLATGLRIMKHLRGRLSGMAIPNFAVDTPGAGGKIELLPEGILETRAEGTLLVNSRGEPVFYPDPEV
ncbi:MAG: KamA family radical SAM protein [Kiritimatiellia bacterium]|jgi:lysine 2,3-aminomutase